jgi:hypothetical protein
MLSESIFANLENLRSAAKQSLVFCAATELAATGEKVLITCIGVPDAEGMINVHPYGMIPGEGLVDDGGKITDAGRKAANRLTRFLKDKNGLAFFRVDDRDRTLLVPSKVGKAPKADTEAIFVFAWDNPYELFKDPTELANSTEEQSNES